MGSLRISRRAIALAAVVMIWAYAPGRFSHAQTPAPLPAQAEQAQEGEPEVLLRGPVHEAFAKPVGEQPKPGLVVGKKPPEPVEEIPPENRPQGDNVAWISGYWAWDADRDDYLWVSGVSREIPPSRRWVPGYWTQADGGHQWVSGFWAGAQTAEMSYLPAPPESLEEGPVSPAPGDNHFWVPGCWRYVDNDYVWQPGHWTGHYDNWVWTPHHYVWTPRGCLFVNGFWDYGFHDRGHCFAPVFFPHHRHRHFYRPHFALNFGGLLNFFVHPGRHHYFFGDYYGHRNFHPWFRHHRRNHHDHLFVHLNTRFRRQGIDYRDRLERRHDFYRDHKDRRPPCTLEAWRDSRRRHGERDDFVNDIAARDFRELVAQRRDNFRRTDDDDTLRREREELRDLTDRRRRTEDARERGDEKRGDEKRNPSDGRSKNERPDGRKSGDAGKRGADQEPRLNLPLPTRQPKAADGGEGRQRPEVRPDRADGRPDRSDGERKSPGVERSKQELPRGDVRGIIKRPEAGPDRPQPKGERVTTPNRPEQRAPQVQPERARPEVRPEVRRPTVQPEVRRPEVRPEVRRPEVRPPQNRSPEVRRPAPQIQRSQPQRGTAGAAERSGEDAGSSTQPAASTANPTQRPGATAACSRRAQPGRRAAAG